MMTSSKLRDKFLAKKLKDKTLAILQDKHGAWSYMLVSIDTMMMMMMIHVLIYESSSS